MQRTISVPRREVAVVISTADRVGLIIAIKPGILSIHIIIGTRLLKRMIHRSIKLYQFIFIAAFNLNS